MEVKSYLWGEDVLSSARRRGCSTLCLGMLQAGFVANAGLCQELLGISSGVILLTQKMTPFTPFLPT